ncbi:hypothetical protein YB2330_000349 [Saitoella coloradoensis]
MGKRPTSKNQVGLGKAIMNSRFKNKGPPKEFGTERHTTLHDTKEEASWVKLRSITQEKALDEFLSTAELAGTEFTAERQNIKIITNESVNPYLLTREQADEVAAKEEAQKDKLTVPRRPKWDATTTPAELERNERDSFLEWRRQLAELSENHDLMLTPFERNLEVWRQLWRVIERSELVVQIIDARNPLLYRSPDLEKYVKEIDPSKRNLLLINKSDLLTLKQRTLWADFFDNEGISYRFFSAALAKQTLEEGIEEESDDDFYSEDEDMDDELKGARFEFEDEDEDEEEEEAEEDEEEEEEEEDEEFEEDDEEDLAEAAANVKLDEQAAEAADSTLPVEKETSRQEEYEDEDPRTHILTVEELEEVFLREAPKVSGPDPGNPMLPRRTNIGLVGYPNVGKSSTINALLGAKKVSVSATPGKTKHFQTLLLSPEIVLCDCPGLVFPNFAQTKAELVCNGVMPIDQLREHTGPAALVAQRVPKEVIEGTYGITIHTKPIEEGGDGIPTAEELLVSYAVARGFTKSGQGNPDEARAARVILKDYVKGKVLFCHPPPIEGVTERNFNEENHDVNSLPTKKRAPVTHVSQKASTFIPSMAASSGEAGPSLHTKKGAIDRDFFHSQIHSRPIFKGVAGAAGAGNGLGRVTMYGFQKSVNADGTGKQLTGRKARAALATEMGVDPAQLNSKKHSKMNKREKKRSGAGYD